MKDFMNAVNWKIVGIAQLTGTIGEFINPIATQKIMLIAVMITYFMDWLTGIAASYKEGKAFSSRRMRDAIPKLIAYFAAIVMSVVASVALKAGEFPVPKEWAGLVTVGVLALIFAIEFTSVWENIFRIQPKLKRGIIAKIFDGVNDFINQSDEKAPADQGQPQ